MAKNLAYVCKLACTWFLISKIITGCHPRHIMFETLSVILLTLHFFFRQYCILCSIRYRPTYKLVFHSEHSFCSMLSNSETRSTFFSFTVSVSRIYTFPLCPVFLSCSFPSPCCISDFRH